MSSKKMDAVSRSTYRGASIEIWDRQDAWFWSVIDSQSARGAIGAARSEQEATREACLTIEKTAPDPSPCCADIAAASLMGWRRSLNSLASYLGCDRVVE